MTIAFKNNSVEAQFCCKLERLGNCLGFNDLECRAIWVAGQEMLEPSHFHRTKLLQYLIFGPLRRSPIKIYFDCSLRWRLPLNLHSRKRNTVCDENGKSISCRGNKQMRTTTRLMHTDLIPLVPNRPTSDEKQLRLLMVFYKPWE